MATPAMQAAILKWPGIAKSLDSGVYSHDGRETRLLSWLYAHPSLAQLRGSPSAVLNAMDLYASQHEFLMNLGADKARVVADLIARERPRIVVELGAYVGYSAVLIADAMRAARPDAAPGTLRLWSLELDPLFAAITMSLVELAGLTGIVTVVTGKAGESLQRLCAEGKLTALDLLLLDHVEDLYVQEFETCEELGLLKEGTVIVADNVVVPGAPEYREMVRKHPGLKSEGVKGLIMPGGFEDELEISRVNGK